MIVSGDHPWNLWKENPYSFRDNFIHECSSFVSLLLQYISFFHKPLAYSRIYQLFHEILALIEILPSLLLSSFRNPYSLSRIIPLLMHCLIRDNFSKKSLQKSYVSAIYLWHCLSSSKTFSLFLVFSSNHQLFPGMPCYLLPLRFIDFFPGIPILLIRDNLSITF